MSTKREIRSLVVLRWLRKHPDGASYPDLAAAVGLSVPAVIRACDDLRYIYSEDVIGIPAPANLYRVVLDWNRDSREGEISQIRHMITRNLHMEQRWTTIARNTTNPAEAALMAAWARHSQAHRADLDDRLAYLVETTADV